LNKLIQLTLLFFVFKLKYSIRKKYLFLKVGKPTIYSQTRHAYPVTRETTVSRGDTGKPGYGKTHIGGGSMVTGC